MIQAKCVVVLHLMYCYGWDIEVKDALKFGCMEVTCHGQEACVALSFQSVLFPNSL